MILGCCVVKVTEIVFNDFKNGEHKMSKTNLFWGLLLVLCVGVCSADINTGLVSYWPLDGDYMDAAGVNDGTPSGNPVFVEGAIGQCVEMDGDDFIDCGSDSSLDITSEITMALWFNVESFSRSWETFIARGDDSYRMGRGPGDGNGTHMAAIGNFNGPTVVTDGQWHLLVGVYDGSNMIIYLDGVEDARMADTGLINISSYKFYIGENAQQTGRNLGGLIDEVRLYDRAFTPDDVKELYDFKGYGTKLPSPENGAENVPVDTVLSWQAADYITNPTFEVIFDGGAAQNVGTDTTFDPLGTGNLANGTTYTWQVVTLEPNLMGGDPTRYESPELTFTTIPLVPVITQQPENSWVFEGETSVLSLTAEVVGDPGQAISYQWYFDPNTADNVEPQAISGATTDTLAIEDVDAGDVGTYYCTVTGDAGSVDSDVVRLNLVELIGYWPLDGDASDASGYGNHGILNGDLPAFEEGIIGQAASFTTDGLYEIPDPEHFDQANSAITVYCWIKSSGIGSWNPFVARLGESDLGWQLRKQSGNDTLTFTLRGTSGPDDPDPGVRGIFDNEWHQCVGTYDGQVRKIYLDGYEVYSTVDSGDIAATTAPVAIAGRIWEDGGMGNYFRGMIDDVRIYRGPLSDVHVARMYTEETGIEVCTEVLPADLTGPIGVPDCKVDLYDFSFMAESWLDSTNIDPLKL